MTPIAALQAYDDGPVQWANDALWEALREALKSRGIDAPQALWRDGPYHEPWMSGGLILSQTCGYPYATRLRGTATLIATPIYAVEGCAGPRYSSAILVRASDRAMTLEALRGRIAAFNSPQSQSGWNAFRAAVAPLARDGRFFAGAIETGGHHASMAAVFSGAADVCAIDCVTWALFKRHHAERANGLRRIGWTPSAPGLPLIASSSWSAETIAAIRAAVIEVFGSRHLTEARQALFIAGAEPLPDSSYDEIVTMDRVSRGLGYAALA